VNTYINNEPFHNIETRSDSEYKSKNCQPYYNGYFILGYRATYILYIAYIETTILETKNIEQK